MNDNSNDLPLVPDRNLRRDARAALYQQFNIILGHRQSFDAVVRARRESQGHKVLDSDHVLKELLKTVPKEVAQVIESYPLKQWDRCQVLNQALKYMEHRITVSLA